MARPAEAIVYVYADDRTDLGRSAINLMTSAGIHPSMDIVTIPTSGGIPFAVNGRRRYVGVEEIKMLLMELNGESEPDPTAEDPQSPECRRSGLVVVTPMLVERRYRRQRQAMTVASVISIVTAYALFSGTALFAILIATAIAHWVLERRQSRGLS